jgi:hypothetical protein
MYEVSQPSRIVSYIKLDAQVDPAVVSFANVVVILVGALEKLVPE